MKAFILSAIALCCVLATPARAQVLPPPTISSFSPASGPVGSTVVIDGTNFVNLQNVAFAGVSASGSYVSTQITVTVPSGAETGPIVVTTASGSVSTATDFTVGGAVSPVVTLAATVPSVTTGSGQSGQFTVSIPAPQATGLNVNYTLSGNAVNGTDYALLTGTVKIKKNTTSRTINITPQGGLGGASKKTVKLTLTAGADYTVGTTTPEKVKILAGQ